MIIIKKYPFVRQNEMKDCGISCLDMIIRYYKGFVNKNTLLEMTKTNKNGTTAYHLNEALINFKGAILFATHDHEFIETTANRIIDFKDDGKYVDKMTTYEEYLKLNR